MQIVVQRNWRGGWFDMANERKESRKIGDWKKENDKEDGKGEQKAREREKGGDDSLKR